MAGRVRLAAAPESRSPALPETWAARARAAWTQRRLRVWALRAQERPRKANGTARPLAAGATLSVCGNVEQLRREKHQEEAPGQQPNLGIAPRPEAVADFSWL